MTFSDEYLAEYATDVEIPIGSIVIYHGSIWHFQDVAFMVIDPGSFHGVPGSLTLMPLESYDNPRIKFDDRDPVLYNVRPKSVTLVVLP